MLSRGLLQGLKAQGVSRSPSARWCSVLVKSPYDNKRPNASIKLQDGTDLRGVSFGADKSVGGEVVFTTGMVGYPETLTDPSYRGQIVVLTYPLAGNYGVPDRKIRDDDLGLARFFESEKVQVAGVVVQDYSETYSHWNAHSSLAQWLKEYDVPAIHQVDTRMLTRRIRDQGCMLGAIHHDATKMPAMEDPNVRNLVAEASCTEPRVYGAGNPLKILAVDCGIKHNMIRMLVQRGAEVKVVPWDWGIASERSWFDGLFISNGPGDPTLCQPLINQLAAEFAVPDADVKPIFGICMGNQLMGLAAGANAFKLPFGNRGQNQPVRNLMTNEAFITPQNHGFAIDTTTLSADWKPLFENLNDGTNEGIIHTSRPYFSAQFHPEAQGGPVDTEHLFDLFLDTVKSKASQPVMERSVPPAVRAEVSKVLVLGSGGLSIGQAGEFDYSGSQAIKALKEEGMQVVLMNPNIASVQTNVSEGDLAQADNVYFLPVNAEFIEQIIRRERPDGIVVSMGGQTALNCGVALWEKGILQKYNVKVLGTSIDTIKATEDRDTFAQKLKEINEKIAPSLAVNTVNEAKQAALDIGYPVMVRSAYALGGLGSGICKDEAELTEMANRALKMAPQILVEKSLKGWKEVEYEVVRDAAGNCITVCNMENFDPLGVHTGDSIVIAPSQTLSNEEYHMLRETAIKVVRHLGIVGECNIQYALDPESLEYCIIEVNARLSRSSALASKATGYPLAAVAAKLSLGITLPEIRNAVTQETSACFEPSLDYVVTKIPRWDLSKFERADPRIGSAMKSVGEVMAIGRTFEESFQKALRMVEPSIRGFEPRGDYSKEEALVTELGIPTDQRVYALSHAISTLGWSTEKLQSLTGIDPWFLDRLQRMAAEDCRIKARKPAAGGDVASAMDAFEWLRAKKLGFSDKQIAERWGLDETAVRAARKSHGVLPHVKQIDTVAAEHPAKTNYLYTTYHGAEHDVSFGDKGVMVLGSGAYRIGSSVEFDWCAVSCIRTLRQQGHRALMVNYNPETVSTDYDECDRLYFEELSLERTLDIYEAEAADGVVVSVGGQIPNNLALPLARNNVNVLGTDPLMIDSAEDRYKFSQLMDSIGVAQPAWKELTNAAEAEDFADRVGYPVLVRPSYVLSGAAMCVVYSHDQLHRVLAQAVDVSPEHPVVITKFVEGAQEIEMDAVAKNGVVVSHAISEHVEQAGVHSGDATLVLPPTNVSPFYSDRIKDITERIAKALQITGPFNMQFLAKGADVSVIECNLRASRSFPFVSKTVGTDFIEVATKAMLGQENLGENLPTLDTPVRPTNYTAIKAPMFSFTRLRGADPVLGVEMASTGEVACYGADAHEAFLKSLLATGFKLPQKGILISAQERYLHDLVHPVYKLGQLGYKLYATERTHAFLTARGVKCERLAFPSSGTSDGATCVDALQNNDVDLVINLPNTDSVMLEDNYTIRRTAVDFGVPLITNLQLVTMFADAMEKHTRDPMIGLKPDSLFDYYRKETDADAWAKKNEFH